jgi:hypothetical protein
MFAKTVSMIHVLVFLDTDKQITRGRTSNGTNQDWESASSLHPADDTKQVPASDRGACGQRSGLFLCRPFRDTQSLIIT